jgi:hypothetical protein
MLPAMTPPPAHPPLPARLALCPIGSYGQSSPDAKTAGQRGRPMRQLLLILGLIALAIGLLWIGQGLGVINWPQSSFMIKQIQWAGYGAALAALGLILIWQSKR